jgi:ACS family tartrate transporter-like MFS transporter
LINSVGNIGGFVGPYVVGYIKQTTQSFSSGMLVLAGSLLIAGFLALRVKE